MTDTNTKYDSYTFDEIYEEVDDPEDPEVLLAIAHHYKNGFDTKIDKNKYLEYLQRSAQAGNNKASKELEEYQTNTLKTDLSDKQNQSQKVQSNNTNFPLKGNETVDELVQLADRNNYYACLKLLEMADKQNDGAGVDEYFNKLNRYIQNGETADAYKGNIALKLGDFMANTGWYKDHLAYSRYYYSAARELGNKEATGRLIDAYCKVNAIGQAEKLLKSDAGITEKDKIEFSLKIAESSCNYKSFNSMVLKLVDSIIQNPNATQDQRERANVLSKIVNNGWHDALYNELDDPYCLKLLKCHYMQLENHTAVMASELNEDDFKQLINIYRQTEPEHVMEVLKSGIVSNSDAILKAVYDTPEFKNDELMNYIQQNLNTNKGCQNAYNHILQTYDDLRKEMEKKRGKGLKNPDNYDLTKKLYSSPNDLYKISPKILKCLIKIYTCNNDYKALDNLLLNAIMSRNNDNYMVATSSKEFKNGALLPLLEKNADNDRVKAALNYYDGTIYRVINYLKRKKRQNDSIE